MFSAPTRLTAAASVSPLPNNLDVHFDSKTRITSYAFVSRCAWKTQAASTRATSSPLSGVPFSSFFLGGGFGPPLAPLPLVLGDCV